MDFDNAKQVLLCGTRYGASYLGALQQNDNWQLAGIVAKGSRRSTTMAQQYGVELYKKVDDLDQQMDFACIALPQSIGVDWAQKLLERSVDVLLEHPVLPEHLEGLLYSAHKYQTRCHINSHFAYLPPVQQFINGCKKVNGMSAPLTVNVSCNRRTLFSTIDILMRCFGPFELDAVQVHKVDEKGHYQLCVCTLKGNIAVILSCQNWQHEIDDSKDAPLGHQITVTYPVGTLSLTGTFGPCLWHPLAADGIDDEIPLYNDSPTLTLNQMFYWRSRANAQAMAELADFPLQSIPSYQKPAYLMTLCRTWQQLTERLNPVVPVKPLDSPGSALWQIF